MLQSCSIIGLDATDPSSRVQIGKVILSKLVGCRLSFWTPSPGHKESGYPEQAVST